MFIESGQNYFNTKTKKLKYHKVECKFSGWGENMGCETKKKIPFFLNFDLEEMCI